MAAQNLLSSPEFEGYSSDEEVKDYNDPYDGKLYDMSTSKQGDTYTVTFYLQETFREMSTFLEHIYEFESNKNNTGLVTQFNFDKKKVILTLYKTKKLLIQGAGGRVWRNSVFRK